MPQTRWPRVRRWTRLPTRLAPDAQRRGIRPPAAVPAPRALRDHRGNRSAAARSLGIGRRTLYTKMEKLGLVPTWTLGAPAANGDPRGL